MLSLKDCLDLLESDINAQPPRFSVHQDLPFAILRYNPQNEWELRRQVKLLATRLEENGKRVHQFMLSTLLWEAIEETEGIEEVAALEQAFGFDAAQEQVTMYLKDRDWSPLPDMICNRMKELDPEQDIVFLLRAGAMAPYIYYMSSLLDEMKGRTPVPAILFYPGTLEGTTGLRFMDMPMREAPLGNYRVKIYG